jgi:aspartyl-tRNA(Asn)/glutamyl-tRNA(Gln) amidotransferase subunit B
MSDYRPTIGLEVHAELNTETKMFCNSLNAPESSEPNTQICPVCLAHPGTLPTVNKKAVEHVLTVGTALGSTLADYSEFDRKSYFYPDIPKSYQISQYEFPLVSGGTLAGVDITRVHLEEDTARSSHTSSGSLVDFNRAGVPLMELVTEPVITDAKTAGQFARELQLLLRTLGVSHANLEKGEMRVEANISVSKTDTFGTKVEVKNLNSFRSVERAIEYEIARQIAVLEKGGSITQETRGWDENKQSTFSQRAKEGSTDYRYFPEPDIPKMQLSLISEWSAEKLKESLPELPWERRDRYEKLGIRKDDVVTLVADIERSRYFDELIDSLEGSQQEIVLAVNYLINDIGETTPPSITFFSELVRLISSGKVSSRGAKDILKNRLEDEGALSAATRLGLLQESDPEALKKLVESVLNEHHAAVAEYKAGKESALQFLVGQAMKASKGSGNPAVIRDTLLTLLT